MVLCSPSRHKRSLISVKGAHMGGPCPLARRGNAGWVQQTSETTYLWWTLPGTATRCTPWRLPIVTVAGLALGIYQHATESAFGERHPNTPETEAQRAVALMISAVARDHPRDFGEVF